MNSSHGQLRMSSCSLHIKTSGPRRGVNGKEMLKIIRGKWRIMCAHEYAPVHYKNRFLRVSSMKTRPLPIELFRERESCAITSALQIPRYRNGTFIFGTPRADLLWISMPTLILTWNLETWQWNLSNSLCHENWFHGLGSFVWISNPPFCSNNETELIISIIGKEEFFFCSAICIASHTAIKCNESGIFLISSFLPSLTAN